MSRALETYLLGGLCCCCVWERCRQCLGLPCRLEGAPSWRCPGVSCPWDDGRVAPGSETESAAERVRVKGLRQRGLRGGGKHREGWGPGLWSLRRRRLGWFWRWIPRWCWWQRTRLPVQGAHDPLEAGTATPSGLLAWRTARTGAPGELPPVGPAESGTPGLLTLAGQLRPSRLEPGDQRAACPWEQPTEGKRPDAQPQRQGPQKRPAAGWPGRCGLRLLMTSCMDEGARADKASLLREGWDSPLTLPWKMQTLLWKKHDMECFTDLWHRYFCQLHLLC